MGSIAGILAGVGGEIQKENLLKASYEHEAHNNLASQMEQMATQAVDPELAQKLLEGAFTIRSTPPGKKPPKEATDLVGLMSKHIEKRVQNGAMDVQVPGQKPREAVSAEVSYPPSNVTEAPPPNPMTLNNPGAMSQLPQPPRIGDDPAVQAVVNDPISAQPGSDAPGPVSGMPSPGFVGLPQPPVASGSGGRAPNEYTTDSGEHRAFYRNLPYTPDEQRAANMADIQALTGQAHSMGLTDPADVANFVRDKTVERQAAKWASAGGNWIYNTKDGSVKKAGNNVEKLDPGQKLVDKETGDEIARGVPKVYEGEFDNALAAWSRGHGGATPQYADIVGIKKDLNVNGEPLEQIMKGGVPTWVTRSEAIGKAAPVTLFDSRGAASTGGVQGASRIPAPPVATSTQDALAGIQTTLNQISKVDTLLQNPKYAVTGPIMGRLANVKLKDLGGAGTTPEERDLANRLNSLLKTTAFADGGKNLTGTELDQVRGTVPLLTDTVAEALSKLNVARDNYTDLYNNKVAQMGPRQQNQAPAVNSGGASAIPPPPGRIRFKDKATGRNGTVDSKDFNPQTMDKI